MRVVTRVRWQLLAGAVFVVAFGAYTARANASAPASRDARAQGTTPAPAAQAEMVKRGDYLVNTMGCGDCHTPMKMGPNGPEPDMARFLSGHPDTVKVPPPPKATEAWIASINATGTAWAGPWGISYTQNLTPDPETGVSGTYTEAQFIMTIREGKKQGRGRPILPPMPWQVIRNLTDDDLKAIYAYLKTVKPVKNRVPDPVIAEMK